MMARNRLGFFTADARPRTPRTLECRSRTGRILQHPPITSQRSDRDGEATSPVVADQTNGLVEVFEPSDRDNLVVRTLWRGGSDGEP